MEWSLYNQKEFLQPLKFSNGKTQEDVVKEVLEEIEKGTNIIFIKGICGTGKSAIALNIAKKLGKSSVVVPGKNLQNQYKRDYEDGKYILKDNGEKLNINVMTGRNNHKCQFLQDNKDAIPKIKKEVDSKLHDIFQGIREKASDEIAKDKSADNLDIPCKIKLTEKNWKKIKEYIKKNKEINPEQINDIKDVKRISVASVCPYWSPVFENKYELKQKSMVNATQKKYKGLEDKEFIFYYREPGCKFYEQFKYYINSDVIVFNSLKYKLESLIKRKPSTEAEIIDECDEFLDSFSNQRTINLDRLQASLINPGELNEDNADFLATIGDLVKELKRDPEIKELAEKGEIKQIQETKAHGLITGFLKNKNLIEGFDEESYLYDVLETGFIFADVLEESYVLVEKKEDNLIIKIVTTNLEKRFKEILDNNKRMILMSGTLHEEKVLKEIFGINNFKVIDAETGSQGSIDVDRVGIEFDCKYSNFSSGRFTRNRYLKVLNECVKKAKKPALVHVTAFYDLPTEKEKRELVLDNLISREELKENQNIDKQGQEIMSFKNKEIDVLFSTKAARGMDFPGEECNSIIFTKYPNPDVKDAFWKILRQTKPQYYWDFYKDKARRELLQKVYRGLRSKNDRVSVLSPDCRVLEFFEKNFS